MIGSLEQKVEGEVFILDTNIVTPFENNSLNDLLYEGVTGLEKLPADLLQKRTERIWEVSDLAMKGNLIILGEVLGEITADWETLNKHIKYFKRQSGLEDYHLDRIRELEEYGFEKFKLIKKIGRKEYRIGFRDDLDRSKEISNALEQGHNLFVQSLGSDYREKFKKILSEKGHSFDVQKEDYQGKFKVNFNTYIGFLKMALDSSHKCKIAAIRNSLQLRSPGCKGLLLDTDSKIVAAASAISDICPVTILTRDYGMNYQIENVANMSKDGEQRRKYGLHRASSRKINIFNPEKALETATAYSQAN